MNRLKVLVSAYACEPGKGSEPGVGWSMARELAQHHDVWVLTRANNRSAIEAELASRPQPNLRFEYLDLPRWSTFWKRGGRGVQLYYYLWQLAAYRVARRLHSEIGFGVAAHATFVKYWAPSLICFLPVPFIWGPVGGGESAPRTLWTTLPWRARVHEWLREVARGLAELDPLVRLTAKRSALALAATSETAERIARLGARHVKVMPQTGLLADDIEMLGSFPDDINNPVRFICVGNLLALKGFHFALQAFQLARGSVGASELWLVGDGPEMGRLKEQASQLNIGHDVRFFGRLPRIQTLHKIAESSVLILPSLHDSGGFVCTEAMAAGRPVICLDLGGPAIQVTEATGFKIPATTPDGVVAGISDAMVRLASDPDLRVRLGQAGKWRVRQNFSWETKGKVLADLYREVARG